MKFAIVFAAIVALASAAYLKPVDTGLAEMEAIVAAIQSPSTDPATAALLEQQLAEIIAAQLPVPAPSPEPVAVSPIVVGPALIDFPLPDGGAVSADAQPAPIDISPVLIDFPLPDGGAVSADELPAPESPAVVAEAAPVAVAPAAPAAASSPLVQIIVNVNSAATGSEVAEAPVVAAPAPVPAPVEDVSPVIVVEEAENLPTAVPEPVQVVEVAPTPVLVVDAAPTPVQVVDAAPEPVLVGEIVIPVAPVVTLPDILN